MTLEGSGIYVENIFVIIKKILVVIWTNGSYKKGGSKKTPFLGLENVLEVD